MAVINPFARYRPPVQQAGPSVENAAAAYAQQRAGYSPRAVMQEGTVTVQNGVPGVMIKYNVAGGGPSTEWTPLPGYQGGNVPMNAIGGGGGGGSVAGGGFRGLGAGYQGMRGLPPFVSQILDLVSVAGRRPSWAGPQQNPQEDMGIGQFSQPGPASTSGGDFLPAGDLTPRFEGAPDLEDLLRMVRQQTQAAKARVAGIAR